MRTMILAAAAALSLSAGSAFADGEGGPSDTAFFNRQVLAQAPSYRPAAVAGNQATGAPTAAFVPATALVRGCFRRPTATAERRSDTEAERAGQAPALLVPGRLLLARGCGSEQRGTETPQPRHAGTTRNRQRNFQVVEHPCHLGANSRTERIAVRPGPQQHVARQHPQSSQGARLRRDVSRIERGDHRGRGLGEHRGQRREAAKRQRCLFGTARRASRPSRKRNAPSSPNGADRILHIAERRAIVS